MVARAPRSLTLCVCVWTGGSLALAHVADLRIFTVYNVLSADSSSRLKPREGLEPPSAAGREARDRGPGLL
eukprot:scaffold48356_cov63-Phaeocystis_antarctica.AAC.7